MSDPIHQQEHSAEQGRPRGQVVPFRTLSTTAPATFPSFTWDALEQQLSQLAVTPAQRRLVRTLVSATRKQAAFKPADEVLREVLCIASVLMDETFHPQTEEGEMT